MLTELNLPQDREWKPYILRHSLAQLCRAAGVVKWDLQDFTGHVDSGQTETYAPGGDFASVTGALNRILDQIDSLRPGALHRSACSGHHTDGAKNDVKSMHRVVGAAGLEPATPAV